MLIYLQIHILFLCLPSPQTVSDGAVCLCKFRKNLTKYLILNMWSILQRGRVLTAFRLSEQLNVNAMNKGDLFVALVFYGVGWFQ